MAVKLLCWLIVVCSWILRWRCWSYCTRMAAACNSRFLWCRSGCVVWSPNSKENNWSVSI